MELLRLPLRRTLISPVDTPRSHGYPTRGCLSATSVVTDLGEVYSDTTGVHDGIGVDSPRFWDLEQIVSSFVCRLSVAVLEDRGPRHDRTQTPEHRLTSQERVRSDEGSRLGK